MGEIEINPSQGTIYVHSNIALYGDLASNDLAKQFGEEIEDLWNEVEGIVRIEDRDFLLIFRIESTHLPSLTPQDILENRNPRNNYFRVEDYSPINISWVDGIGSNTGYMLIDNLYKGSTTAAHEYGHTIGLEHPKDLNLIGKGQPGIMYPRGTLVDREFQYDPNKLPGEAGGTMHPIHRRVWQSEIDLLQLPNIISLGGNVLGTFTNQYHGKLSKSSVS